MPSPENPPHTRYEVLDGMRGIAAILVMLYHFTQGLAHPLFFNSSIAVDMFFLMSGFVISHAYGERLLKGMSYIEYFLKRVIRLYPMLILSVIIGSPILYLLALSGMADNSLNSIFGSFFYNSLFLPDINNFKIISLGGTDGVTGEIFPVNPPAWSLFFEMVASLSFPLLYRLPAKALFRFVAASFVILILLAAISGYRNYHASLDISGGWGEENFLVGFPRVFYGFSAGILLYHFRQDVRLRKINEIVGHFIKHPVILYVAIVVICSFSHFLKGLYPALIIAFVTPCIVYAGSQITCDGKLSLKVAQFLGWISYPLYCLHYPIGRVVFFVCDKAQYSHEIAALLSYVLSVVLSMTLSIIYEKPVRAYFSRKLARGH